jgi:hypothetical protein
MLSPNARNFFTLSRGTVGFTTVTVNVQFAGRCSESVTLHVTGVVPTVYVAPLTGLQLSVNGAWPPAIAGSP